MVGKGLSCNSGLLGNVPVEQAIDLLAQEGYQAIDISLELAPPFLPAPPPHMSPHDAAPTRRRVRTCAEKAGIAIAALNAHTNLIAGTSEERQANLKFVQGAIQLAADLEAPCVVFGGGRKTLFGFESQYWDGLVTALQELLKEAERLGIMIAVEAGSNYGSLVHNTQRMQRLLGYGELESLQVTFDPGHYYVRGDSPLETFRALSEHVAHFHAKDAKGDQEDWQFPPLGQGDIDFTSLFTAVAESSYRGYISVEYEAAAWGYPDEPRQVLSESKRFLDRFLSSSS